ncbi:MAG: type II toxin-antitoxin system PemK/MazF family toxin [Deferrisomatales bacterium]
MRRGEIWLVNLDPVQGAEIRKTRPAVIVSDDAVGVLPLRVIVPITEWKERFAVAPWLVLLEPDVENGLDKRSAADAFQVRSVSQQRFVRRLGSLSPTHLRTLNRALAAVLSIEPESPVPEP